MSQSVEERCLELELAVGLICQVLRAHVSHHAPADGVAPISVQNARSLLEQRLGQLVASYGRHDLVDCMVALPGKQLFGNSQTAMPFHPKFPTSPDVPRHTRSNALCSDRIFS